MYKYMQLRVVTSIVILTLFGLNAQVQAQDFVPAFIAESNSKIRSLTKRTTENGWLFFKDDANLAPGVMLENKPALGLTKLSKFEIFEELLDKYGTSHYKYQQHHAGIPIEGAMFTEHVKEGFVESSHGRIVELDADFKTKQNQSS
jgi:Zn-dependent metalloprotease